ncbi:hypothetical protein ACQP1G_37430 [Nocardia sp. CA-107356]|uniref:hypothetical protein n=1 Tax=Nocardia sp. CA-107356 TaxID=3239972 RepID=UPI003D93F3BF
MPQRLNQASALIRVPDTNDRQVIASTDGHRIRVRIRDTDNLATEWFYADRAPETADALTTAIATRHRPVRWLTPRRRRQAANR